MAKIHNIEDLRKLHAEKKALKGVVYQTEDDRVDGVRYFLGDEIGRLEEITDVTLIDNNVTNITTNETDITALEAEDARLEAVKADKCFIIATQMFLG